MNQELTKNIDKTNANKAYINEIRGTIIDKQASKLFEDLKWIKLEDISLTKSDLFPTVLTGKGEKILLIHGFYSCFLEYRRLTPLLNKNHNSTLYLLDKTQHDHIARFHFEESMNLIRNHSSKNHVKTLTLH